AANVGKVVLQANLAIRLSGFEEINRFAQHFREISAVDFINQEKIPFLRTVFRLNRRLHQMPECRAKRESHLASFVRGEPSDESFVRRTWMELDFTSVTAVRVSEQST